MIGLLCAVALAGPWTRDQGSVYAKLGADGYRTLRYVLPAETGIGVAEAATQSFFGHQYSLYAEIGVSDGWPIQLAGRIPLTVGQTRFSTEDGLRTVMGTATSVRGGDLELFPQIALTRRWPVAFALGVKIPLYNIDAICRESPYKAFCPRPGDGQLDLTPWLLAGGSFAGGRAWIEGQLGYRHRTELFRNWDTQRAFVDSFAFGGTVGARWGPALAMLRLDGNRNFAGLFYTPMPDDPALRDAVEANGGEDPFTAQSVRVGPQGMLFLTEHWALEARAAWDLWARSTSIGVGFGVGLSWSGVVTDTGKAATSRRLPTAAAVARSKSRALPQTQQARRARATDPG